MRSGKGGVLVDGVEMCVHPLAFARVCVRGRAVHHVLVRAIACAHTRARHCLEWVVHDH